MAQHVANAPAPALGYAEGSGPSENQRPARRVQHRHTYGAIDLGTNNCRLLVARPTEGGFTVIDAFSRAFADAKKEPNIAFGELSPEEAATP